jgi:hypothetical protein
MSGTAALFARLGIAIEPARAAAIAVEQDALAARLASHALRPAFEAEPSDFQRAQVEVPR